MARIEVFARTEVGCTRERNEDAFAVLDLGSGESGIRPAQRVREIQPPGLLVAVCDGMGGAAAGDVASRMAIDALQRVARSRMILQPADAEQVLLAGVTEANRTIAEFTRRHPDKRGMGTTLTAAVIMGVEVVIVQVGDSRAYLRRGRMLQQLTMDQNVVGQMVAAGKLRPEDARNFKQRNVLLEAVGVQERVGPDVVRVSVRAGDVLMLCSDGLTGPLNDRQILDHMLRHEDPVRCCRALTEAACAAGGPDNVSVAMVRFVGSDLPLPHGREAIEFERRSAVA
ncbi:PP2C family protein-serine/threonine phosphatase [Paraliomyxa miuraensis]|uniref:PP2C family protein-serine/threonine phosphatase n=1 Tax=Paraliomyxa miuraensis TaxID=376150 RepID=UPI00225B4666|nr:protein phosphatase 2C domain-containing protein [Paraliomyxa miuraensis]MCX4244562.1 protein phosphatase 2C domain-containing protein [Paraliomyxa miuraensis]